MGLIDEIKSGQYTIYAQFLALITVIVLVSTGSASFPIIPLGWIWAILSWVGAGLILLLELPILTRCCPTRGSLGNFLAYFEGIMLRAILYLLFSIVMFTGSSFTALLSVASGLFLMFVSGMYAVAAVKGQEMKRSVITGGQGL